MAVASNARSKIYIGTTVAASTETEFAADTYVEVGQVEDAGSIGDKADEISVEFLGDARKRKFKGSRDAGVMELVCGFDALDAGQIALRAAAASDLNYNFKVVLNDAPDATGTPSEMYFRGLVMGSENSLGKASDVVKQTFSIGVNSEVLLVPAEAGV